MAARGFSALWQLSRLVVGRAGGVPAAATARAALPAQNRRWCTATPAAPTPAAAAGPEVSSMTYHDLKLLKQKYPRGEWLFQLDDAAIVQLSQRTKVNGW